jgi:hypothetical protein
LDSSSRGAGVIAIVAVLGAPRAFAAHPLVTEDTATQGAGNVELENGLSRAQQGSARVFEYQPQISYGLLTALDLIVQPSWLAEHPASGPQIEGLGDTNFDAKWRFFGAAPWSWAIRAGITASTNRRGLGLPAGRTSEHAVLVLTYDEAPLAVHINAGLIVNPRDAGLQRSVGHFSTAVMWSVNAHLILTGEAAVDSNPDSSGSSWGGSALAGAVYTVRSGLDIDFGYQVGLHAEAPTHTWLGGITYRFAL